MYHDYFIFEINLKLFNQRVDLFKVLEKVENLTYQFELSDVMRIHLIIFITQLKSISNRFENLYFRTFIQFISLIEEI